MFDYLAIFMSNFESLISRTRMKNSRNGNVNAIYISSRGYNIIKNAKKERIASKCVPVYWASFSGNAWSSYHQKCKNMLMNAKKPSDLLKRKHTYFKQRRPVVKTSLKLTLSLSTVKRVRALL